MAGVTQVQDTTWDLSFRGASDPYVKQVSSAHWPQDILEGTSVIDAIGKHLFQSLQVSRYFTKYAMSDNWRHHDVHGLFADGTLTPKNDTFGAWMIMNTKDTYFVRIRMARVDWSA